VNAVFPPRGEERMPEWLGWSAPEWQKYGLQWYDVVDKALRTTTYATAYFQTESV